jgi:hypothetical protein
MKDKNEIKVKIEMIKNQINQHKSISDGLNKELAKLEQDYKRSGPRYFMLKERSSSDKKFGIVGQWDPFTVIELDSKPSKQYQGKDCILLKEMTEEDFK